MLKMKRNETKRNKMSAQVDDDDDDGTEWVSTFSFFHRSMCLSDKDIVWWCSEQQRDIVPFHWQASFDKNQLMILIWMEINSNESNRKLT